MGRTGLQYRTGTGPQRGPRGQNVIHYNDVTAQDSLRLRNDNRGIQLPRAGICI